MTMRSIKLMKCLQPYTRLLVTPTCNFIGEQKLRSYLHAPTNALRCYSASTGLFNSVSGWPMNRDLEPIWRISVSNTTQIQQKVLLNIANCRHFATDIQPQQPERLPQDGQVEKPEPKQSLWQRFKKMYKEYWYVLIPVHTVTSIFWYGSFYYMAISGIDIVPLLEKMGANEWILQMMKDTGAGYFAVAYGMYKIATPARYTVTVGGTTITINYLKKWGYIKPMPSGEQMKAMLRERGRQLRSSRAKVLAKMNLRRKGVAKSKITDEEKK